MRLYFRWRLLAPAYAYLALASVRLFAWTGRFTLPDERGEP